MTGRTTVKPPGTSFLKGTVPDVFILVLVPGWEPPTTEIFVIALDIRKFVAWKKKEKRLKPIVLTYILMNYCILKWNWWRSVTPELLSWRPWIARCVKVEMIAIINVLLIYEGLIR